MSVFKVFSFCYSLSLFSKTVTGLTKGRGTSKSRHSQVRKFMFVIPLISQLFLPDRISYQFLKYFSYEKDPSNLSLQFTSGNFLSMLQTMVQICQPAIKCLKIIFKHFSSNSSKTDLSLVCT